MVGGGCFVTIEGGEGAGKSTLLAALVERAGAAGADVVSCREPGGTALGERLREALLGAPAGQEVPDPRAELLVFAAARAQLVAEVIRPALASGALVVCDRFADSSVRLPAPRARDSRARWSTPRTWWPRADWCRR